MAKHTFLFKFLMSTLCLAGQGSAFAMSLSDAQAVERTADKFAIANDFKSSFRVIREMIEKAEASENKAAAEIGYRFLMERQLIANEAIQELTPKFIARTVCENGFDKGMSKLNAILSSKIASTAQSEVIAEKTILLKNINEIYGLQKEDACQNERALEAADREQQQALDRKKTAEVAERTKLAPSVLRNADDITLCGMFGSHVSGKTPAELLDVKNAEALIQSELKRRGLSADRKLILEEKIRIGASECTVYASWGSPKDVNRSVGSWGVNKQLIYGPINYRTYIYINNGKVTSFQD
jgi:hypothetical protein